MLLLLACSSAELHTSDDDTGTPPRLDRGTEDVGHAPGVVEDTGEDTETSADDTAADARAEAEYAAFYDPLTLQEIRLTIADDAMRALDRNPTVWQKADVEINGVSLPDIAVRIKGSSTLRTFRDKPSLKFKLNAYVQGQKYGGLERVTLNNMVEDASQAKEWFAYRVFDEAGLVASRASWAHLWVNDEDYGLYNNLEAMDDHWLERRYADATGQLWEANDGADFATSALRSWEIASGTDDDASLRAVIAATQTHSGDFYADMDGVVDMDQYLAFWAWTIVVGNSDGYPYTTNDVFLYGDPSDAGRFDFAPWGMDESFSDYMVWSSASCILGSRCLQDAGCEVKLREAILTALDVYDTWDVSGWAEEGFALSDDLATADPRGVYSAAAVSRGRESLAAKLESWPAQLRSRLE